VELAIVVHCAQAMQKDEEGEYGKKWLWAFVLRLGKSTKALNYNGRYRHDMSVC
jgi:hypothetical protein